MKIIKHGNVIKTQECYHCGCVFEYDLTDTQEETRTTRKNVGILLPRYQNVKYDIHYVYCPDCRKKIYVT